MAATSAGRFPSTVRSGVDKIAAMPLSDRVIMLTRRIAQLAESIATFVRIREELISMRKDAVIASVRAQYDQQIALNGETLATANRTLMIVENELKRLRAE
jgi:hypothetical protein